MPWDIEKPLELAARPVEAVSNFDRLLLGLSTGAIVLFLNLLNNIHSPRWVSGLLVLSVLSFGLAAVWCLRVLMTMIELRTIMVEATQDQSEDWQRKHVPRVLRCAQRTIRDSDVLQVFFVGGILFAALFVLVFWFVR